MEAAVKPGRRSHSFTGRLLLFSILFLAGTVLILTSFVTLQYGQTIRKQNEQAALASFEISCNQLENLLDGARKGVLSAVSSNTVRDYVTGKYTSQLEKVEAFRSILPSLSSLNDYGVNGVVLITNDGRASGHIGKWVFFDESNATLNAITESAAGSYTLLSAKQQALLIESIPEQYTTFFKQHLAIPLIQRYQYPGSREPIRILISMDEQSLINLIPPYGDDSTLTMMLTEDGTYAAGCGLGPTGVRYGFVDEIPAGSQSGSMISSVDGTRYQIIYYKSARGWMLARMIPYSTFISGSALLMERTLAFSFALLALVSLIFAFWARLFTRPISFLADKLEDVSNSRFDIRLHKNTGIREFDMLYDRFNRMTQNIESFREREKLNQNEKMLLEIRSLQAQINPHFIYNSIASIRWLAMLNGDARVSDMLIELAETLRPIFRKWSVMWTLEEELNFIGHYMKLMHLRYDTQFTIQNSVTVPPSEISVPLFFLQPILENACEHGITPDRKPDIRLDIAQEDENLAFCVRDNGGGIDEEALRTLRAFITDPEPETAPEQNNRHRLRTQTHRTGSQRSADDFCQCAGDCSFCKDNRISSKILAE